MGMEGYSVEEAQNEAGRLQEKVASGDAVDLDKAEKTVDRENKQRAEMAANNKYTEAESIKEDPFELMMNFLETRTAGNMDPFPYSDGEVKQYVDNGLDYVLNNIGGSDKETNYIGWLNRVISNNLPFSKEKAISNLQAIKVRLEQGGGDGALVDNVLDTLK